MNHKEKKWVVPEEYQEDDLDRIINEKQTPCTNGGKFYLYSFLFFGAAVLLFILSVIMRINGVELPIIQTIS